MISSEFQKIKGTGMGQAPDREGALDEKAESRVVSAEAEAMASASTLREALVCLLSRIKHCLHSPKNETSTGCVSDSWFTREASGLVIEWWSS